MVDAYRSIPARAGEPTACRSADQVAPVYPRACGETSTSTAPFGITQGLSSRVRGYQNMLIVRAVAPGSIPARAGEPHGSPLAAYRHIYPLPAALGFDGAAELVGVHIEHRSHPRPPDRLSL